MILPAMCLEYIRDHIYVVVFPPSLYICLLLSPFNHSKLVIASSSPSRRRRSTGSSRISIPGPIDLEPRPAGNIYGQANNISHWF